MEKLIISEEAYNEFKDFLDENKVDNYNIRIYVAGSGCSGPSFNIAVTESQEDDLVIKVKDINFIVKPEIIDEYGVLTILSSEENNGLGLAVKPLIEPEGGCAGCSGCH